VLTAVMLSSTGALSMGAAGGLGVGAAREAGPASSAVSETAGGARVGGGRAGGQWFGSGGAHQQFDGDQHGERKVRPSSVGRDSMALRGESASWTDPLRVPAIKPCGSAISGVASDGSSVV
jgi:hypothetical protein